MARPKNESAPGLFTDADDLKTVLNLIKGKRLNFKDMICEIHSPSDAQTVFDRLINEKNFPIGVLFDWKHPGGNTSLCDYISSTTSQQGVALF